MASMSIEDLRRIMFDRFAAVMITRFVYVLLNIYICTILTKIYIDFIEKGGRFLLG